MMAAGTPNSKNGNLNGVISDNCSHFTAEKLQKLANIKGPISSNEFERVQALRNSKALDLEDFDERFMRLIELAEKVCKVPNLVCNPKSRRLLLSRCYQLDLNNHL